MKKMVLRLSSSLCFFLLFVVACVAKAQDFDSLSTGTPQYLGKQIGPENYVPVEAKRIKDARVLWVNRALLRELGMEVPDGPLSPEFEKKFLDAFAYRIPNEAEKADAFVPGMTKTFYADRYGGTGQVSNAGSGRAASAGKVQIKGIGRTPLVSKSTPYDHAHGGASIEESIREAIWGEVNHNELPMGSNRILGVIDSSDRTNWKVGADGALGNQGKIGFNEARGLVIRMDPIRPAAYVVNPNLEPEDSVKTVIGGHEVSETERVAVAIQHLPKALPQDAQTLAALAAGEKLSDERLLQSGMKEFAKRLGEQFGGAYARGLFHGAISTSNVELDGRFLDFGSQTAQPGFGNIRFLEYLEEGSGENELTVLRSEVLDYLNTNVSHYSSEKSLPSETELNKLMRESYFDKLGAEIPAAMGVPPELVARMQGKGLSGNELSKVFLKLALVGSAPSDNPLHIAQFMPDKTAAYDMRKALVVLAKHPEASADEVKKLLLAELLVQGGGPTSPDAKFSKMIDEFSKEYSSYMAAAHNEAKSVGLSEQAFRVYLRERAKLMNRPLKDLYRAEMVPQNWALLSEYGVTRDAKLIGKSIDSRIRAGVRTPRGLAPYEIQLATNTGIEGTELRTIYNALDDNYRVVLETHMANGKAWIGGKEFTEEELKIMRLNYGGAAGTGEAVAEFGAHGLVRFEVPVKEVAAGPMSVKLTLKKGLHPWNSWAVKLNPKLGTQEKAIDTSVSAVQSIARSKHLKATAKGAMDASAKFKSWMKSPAIQSKIDFCAGALQKLIDR